MTIEEMRQIKKEKGYSYAQIARMSGVPLGTLQKIFTGETQTPRYETLQALEHALTHEAVHYQIKNPIARVAERSFEYGTTPVNKQQGNYTVEDLKTLPSEKRYELIDGYLFQMEAPSTFHQLAAGEIYRQISNFIIDHDGDCTPFIAPVDVQLDEDDRTMVQPDIVIVCDPNRISAKNIVGAPDFVLEVLSPGTKAKDSVIKLEKYHKAGVREYWIVDPYQKIILVYDLKGEGGVTIYPIQQDVPVGIYDQKLVINLSRLMPRLPE